MAKKTTEAPEVKVSERRSYELMLIAHPELLESKLKKKLKEFEDFITENGGVLTMTDIWDKQKLAYRIKKHKEGIYVVFNMEIPGEALKAIDEHLRIDVDILRHIIISLAEGYTYTRFKEEAVKPEAKDRDGNRRRHTPERERNASYTPRKEQAPIISEVKKPKEAPKAIDEEALDKKLDEIIGGGDLNL
ncbi:30S ribosomal protein S6 [Candidatus Peregrinibacteria bacterium CG_4_10_14_0_2_um_filter_43_11]|nr:MAG: 30S ribosomal protein S6 [Candidatus Peregrinibacteria bacterium CG_4_10_14_0_2_um_filter_43_11]